MDESLAPVLLNETNYVILLAKYNRTAPNVIQVSFTLAERMIPTGAHAYSSKKSSIEFINSQMNALTADLPGYGVGMNGQNQYSDVDFGPNYG